MIFFNGTKKWGGGGGLKPPQPTSRPHPLQTPGKGGGVSGFIMPSRNWFGVFLFVLIIFLPKKKWLFGYENKDTAYLVKPNQLLPTDNYDCCLSI